MKKQPPMQQGQPDDYQTPAWAVYPLLKYLKKEWLIWEPAAGECNIVRVLEKEGYRVLGTDINQGDDFLRITKTNADCIVTNPPYSLKNEFLAHCYKINKSFALLMPLTTLETPRRQALFSEYGVQILFLDRRVNFERKGADSGAWFASAWFTWGLDLEKDLVFPKFNNNLDLNENKEAI